MFLCLPGLCFDLASGAASVKRRFPNRLRRMLVDTWSPTLALERFELLRRVWSLTGDAGDVLAPQLRLRPDRRLACGGEPGLVAWDVRGDTLVLLDRAGRARLCFDGIEDEGGRSVLRGSDVDDPERTLVLRETDPVERWPEPAARHAPQPLGEGQPRRHLVVAEASGRVAAWTRDLAPEDRSWDLCLLGPDDPDDDTALADYAASPRGAGRWDALHTLLYPGSTLFRYDHVAFADDGVLWSWAGINEALAACHAHDLLLAHPTVAPTGGVAARFHPAPGRRLGFGTPVELLCPIFSAEALRVCAPTFALAPAGAPELAQLWSALLGAPMTRIAVIDAAPPITLAEATARAQPMPELLARYGLAADPRDAGALHDAPAGA